ncbi:hypothetical protein [Phytohabitans aurantiacus]|uniref:DUF222 domain-containing protein n=1 Tax=Phytohabitans aurantiacus TaxID=3016789 RepID=A0ABQ5R305_9ACTN|nr:hypothetical protein [Phytohabitans aurantiacus]GLI00923.1 hypothetical protein Pa4123_61990 [Phytohabitans aurantiacus]
MDGIGQGQHPDAVAEVGQRLGQGLAVLATLSEAAARLAAEEMRRRARSEEDAERAEEREHGEREREERKRERENAKDRNEDELAHHAQRRRAAQRDRRLIALTLEPDWLAHADLYDLATVWRVAWLREGEFPEARMAAEQVEERLREIYPRPMDLYGQAVANGVSRAAAMRAAAFEMAQTRPSRPHGGQRSAGIEAGPEPVVGVDGFDTAVDQERARLADGIHGAAFAEELERLGAGGAAAAQALREILQARAGEHLGHAQAAAATPDDPSTAGVNEHATMGLPRSARDVGEGSRDQADARTAAQLAAEWYPEGLHHPAALPADVAVRQPASTRTRTPTGKRTSVRAR